MKCSLLTLSCALDGELSRERQLELDAHLITCERCKTGMRYLREETERISLLAPVRLSTDKATALLERSRVVVSLGSPLLTQTSDEDEQDRATPLTAAPDPFGALGIGAAILEAPEAIELPTTTPPEELSREAEPELELEHGSAFEADEADRTESDALAAIPEELWLADTPETQAGGSVPAEEPPTEAAWDPESSVDEVMAPTLDQEPEATEEEPAAELEPVAEMEPAPDAEETLSPENRPSSMVVPGWEPATELKVPWRAIPAANPSEDTWMPDLAAVPLSGESSLLPPAAPFPAPPPPERPSAAAVPGLQADRKSAGSATEIPRRSAGGGSRRPVPAKPGDDNPQPRSWTRTGLIAVAALAVVLILWNVTHGSSPSAAGSHHPRGQTTPAVSAKPSPSAAVSPTATPTPLALTGSQTVGSTGSSYVMQTVRYGVHGSQYWVVFQMVQGSGSPKITCAFDGPETLYVEMQGVAPGTPVPQPPAGAVVSSISIGHVSGFSGAVYILHLTKAMQVSPSELPGTESGGAGERYVAILQ
jgi:hypothetical protein